MRLILKPLHSLCLYKLCVPCSYKRALDSCVVLWSLLCLFEVLFTQYWQLPACCQSVWDSMDVVGWELGTGRAGVIPCPTGEVWCFWWEHHVWKKVEADVAPEYVVVAYLIITKHLRLLSCFYFFICVCMFVCVMSMHAWRGQKKVSDPWELEFRWFWATCVGVEIDLRPEPITTQPSHLSSPWAGNHKQKKCIAHSLEYVGNPRPRHQNIWLG